METPHKPARSSLLSTAPPSSSHGSLSTAASKMTAAPCHTEQPTMHVTSSAGKRLWEQCLTLGRDGLHFESPTLDPVFLSQSRQDIYDAVMNGLSRLRLADKRRHGSKNDVLSETEAEALEARRAVFNGVSTDIATMKRGERLVLGALVGTLCDVVLPAQHDTIQDSKMIGNDRDTITQHCLRDGSDVADVVDGSQRPSVAWEGIQLQHRNPSTTSCVTPRIVTTTTTTQDPMLPSSWTVSDLLCEPTCFAVTLSPTPNISFSSSLSIGQQCLTVSEACPALYVPHHVSSWDMLHDIILGTSRPAITFPDTVLLKENAEWHMVTALGLPFLLLTTKPSVVLQHNDFVVADRGVSWTREARRRAWLRVWVEAMSRQGCYVARGNIRAASAAPVTASALPSAVIRELLTPATRCRICSHRMLSGSVSEDTDACACACCGGTYHVACLPPDEQEVHKQSLTWACISCRNAALSCTSGGAVRGDESPLNTLNPCETCGREARQSAMRMERLNLRCRVELSHVGSPTASPRRITSQARVTIRALAKALQASELRNAELHRAVEHSRHMTPEMQKALDFWTNYKKMCRVYETSKEKYTFTAPTSLFVAQQTFQDDDSACDIVPRSVAKPQPHRVVAAPLDRRSSSHTRIQQTRNCHTSHLQRPECSETRPQSIARVLLRGAFDPDRSVRASSSFDSCIAFNEANLQAKRLRPWPRGISWNTKRLTWSVRFWANDGRTLVATSIPARKHGGVDEAFQKAVALRRKSYSNVLGRVADDLLNAQELPSLEWNRNHNHWIATDATTGVVHTFPAASEEAVYATWLEALQWLSARHDDVATTLLYHSTPAPDLAMESRTNVPIEARDSGTAEDREPAEPLQRLEARQTNQSVKALQPLPPGLIWARTTNRFFAVFRDPSGSLLHRKKRFKTFDPKKYGGVYEAHKAAMEFLSSVEPWVTQGAAGSRRGGRRGRGGGRSSTRYSEDPSDGGKAPKRVTLGLQRSLENSPARQIKGEKSPFSSPASAAEDCSMELAQDDSALLDPSEHERTNVSTWGYTPAGKMTWSKNYLTTEDIHDDEHEAIDDDNYDNENALLARRLSKTTNPTTSDLMRSNYDEAFFDTDDSLSDADAQAQRLPSVNHIHWVPHTQAFHTEESGSFSYNVFSAEEYHGVKRAFRQALLFVLQKSTP